MHQHNRKTQTLAQNKTISGEKTHFSTFRNQLKVTVTKYSQATPQALIRSRIIQEFTNQRA